MYIHAINLDEFRRAAAVRPRAIVHGLEDPLPDGALVAATRTGAEVIGGQDRLGTIEPGKLADLLVLSADPLADVSNLPRIETVVLNGVPLARKSLAYGATSGRP